MALFRDDQQSAGNVGLCRIRYYPAAVFGRTRAELQTTLGFAPANCRRWRRGTHRQRCDDCGGPVDDRLFAKCCDRAWSGTRALIDCACLADFGHDQRRRQARLCHVAVRRSGACTDDLFTRCAWSGRQRAECAESNTRTGVSGRHRSSLRGSFRAATHFLHRPRARKAPNCFFR